MCLSMPDSATRPVRYDMIDGPSAMAFSDVHGLNRNPSVNMSESERMPGYLNKSQVSPMLLRRSRTAYVLVGQRTCRCQGALIPEMPAPMMRTSRCSVMSTRYQQRVE